MDIYDNPWLIKLWESEESILSERYGLPEAVFYVPDPEDLYMRQKQEEADYLQWYDDSRCAQAGYCREEV